MTFRSRQAVAVLAFATSVVAVVWGVSCIDITPVPAYVCQDDAGNVLACCYGSNGGVPHACCQDPDGNEVDCCYDDAGLVAACCVDDAGNPCPSTGDAGDSDAGD